MLNAVLGGQSEDSCHVEEVIDTATLGNAESGRSLDSTAFKPGESLKNSLTIWLNRTMLG